MAYGNSFEWLVYFDSNPILVLIMASKFLEHYILSVQKLWVGPHISNLMLICSFFHKIVSSMQPNNSKWKLPQKHFHMLTSLLQHIRNMYGLLFHYLVFFLCPSSSFLFLAFSIHLSCHNLFSQTLFLLLWLLPFGTLTFPGLCCFWY